jgi:hypothetical protein
MVLEMFGARVKLIQSTSPVPGKLAASVLESDNSVRPDLFLWDPLGSVVQFDEDRLSQLLADAKRSQHGWATLVLMVTDFAISVVKRLRSLFGGSYGGSLGFGGLGSMVAIASAMLFIVAALAAAVVVIPLSILAWVLRSKVNADISVEKEKVLANVIVFFRGIQEDSSVVIADGRSE